MLLTVDIGNTNITLGVFEGKKLHVTFRMTTIQTRTSDEYGMVMCELLEHNDVKVEEITDVIVASVVPNVMHSLTSAIIKYFHTKPIIIEAGVKTGIRVASKNPRQVQTGLWMRQLCMNCMVDRLSLSTTEPLPLLIWWMQTVPLLLV